jgi:hypothetical protein
MRHGHGWARFERAVDGSHRIAEIGAELFSRLFESCDAHGVAASRDVSCVISRGHGVFSEVPSLFAIASMSYLATASSSGYGQSAGSLGRSATVTNSAPWIRFPTSFGSSA